MSEEKKPKRPAHEVILAMITDITFYRDERGGTNPVLATVADHGRAIAVATLCEVLSKMVIPRKHMGEVIKTLEIFWDNRRARERDENSPTNVSALLVRLIEQLKKELEGDVLHA